MNERIQELAEQAKGFVDLNQHVGGEKGCMVYTYDGLEKFAELIVRECAGLLKQESENYSLVGSSYCDNKAEGFDEAVDMIKQHFGVEE